MSIIIDNILNQVKVVLFDYFKALDFVTLLADHFAIDMSRFNNLILFPIIFNIK